MAAARALLVAVVLLGLAGVQSSVPAFGASFELSGGGAINSITYSYAGYQRDRMETSGQR